MEVVVFWRRCEPWWATFVS